MFLDLYQPVLLMSLCSSYISGSPPQQDDGEESINPMTSCHEFSTRCSYIIFNTDTMKCSDMDSVDECLQDLLLHCQLRQQLVLDPQSNVSGATTSSSLQRPGSQAKQQPSKLQKGKANARDSIALKNATYYDHLEDLTFLQENLMRLRHKSCSDDTEDTNAGTKVTWLSKPSLIGRCCIVFCFMCFHWLTIVLFTFTVYS